MTTEIGPKELFGAIGRALDDVDAGREVDCAALRAMLRHLEDQVGATGRDAPTAWAAGVISNLVTFFRELHAVVDRLEAEDSSGARQAFLAAMRSAFGRGAV